MADAQVPGSAAVSDDGARTVGCNCKCPKCSCCQLCCNPNQEVLPSCCKCLPDCTSNCTCCKCCDDCKCTLDRSSQSENGTSVHHAPPKGQEQEQPEVEPQKQPDVEQQEQPEVKPQKQPDVEQQEQPEVKPQKQPDVEQQEQPEVKPQKQPDVEQQEQPEVKPQKQPDVEQQEQPEVELQAQVVPVQPVAEEIPDSTSTSEFEDLPDLIRPEEIEKIEFEKLSSTPVMEEKAIDKSDLPLPQK